MRTISVSTALFDGYPMDRALGEIAAAGGKWIEPAFIKGYVAFEEDDFSISAGRALTQAIAREGLGSIAVSAHMDCGAENAASMLERRIRFAGELGARFLVSNAGKLADREKVFATIQAVLPLCESSGVTLALENPGHGSEDLFGNAAQGRRCVEMIGSEWVRLNYDAGNVFTYSDATAQPAEDIADALSVVAHLHLKDVADDGEGGWRFTALGLGAIDFSSLWHCLPSHLPVGIELPLRLQRPERRDPSRASEPLPLTEIRTALRQSLDFVRRLDEEVKPASEDGGDATSTKSAGTP